MNKGRHTSTLILMLAVLLNCAPTVLACGPESTEPVFVFKNSPDPPFEEFTRGKLGILQPTMGRKTLFIGYRYVNGGSFTGEEQRALVEALRGKAPEDDGEDAIKGWIEVRKQAAPEDEALPAIYAERQYGGYDFFPNCTRSGFETAIETLKDRVATYGAEDPHVRVWLAGQDKVFQNCASGSSIPQELGPDSPEWLRKDRDYQIAAAHFYSLNFDDARDRLERIAADNESPWRQTADYLVARTLVRQASLTNDAAGKRHIYENAERHLQLVLGSGGKFAGASEKLLALIAYRLRPEERVSDLGRLLVSHNGNENLRQDLIDYVWLLDKFDAQVKKAEQERKEAKNGEKDEKDNWLDPERAAITEAVKRGELIEIFYAPKKPDGQYSYEQFVVLSVKHDTSEAEILDAIVQQLGRKLTPEEIEEIKKLHQKALENRLWLLAPNQTLSKIVDGKYEGDNYYGDRLEDPALNLFPAFLRADELSNWILTFQSTDPNAYAHSLSKWRETDSTVWLLTALSKADKASPHLGALLTQAEKVSHDSAAYPSIAYHLVRLKIDLGKQAEARKLLEDVLSTDTDFLPVSAVNQFRELGMKLAATLSEFLIFGQHKPAAFYKFGRYGRISDLLIVAKSHWNPEYTTQTRVEFEQEVELRYADLLDLEGQLIFDEKTLDVFNTHFPLASLDEVGRHPALPNYLQERVLLTVWTRAVLLKNEKVALKVATEIVTFTPEMKAIFDPYLAARSGGDKEHAALLILLRSPNLSPYVAGGLPIFSTSEESGYYFQTSWWCTPSDTEYDDYGNEVKKIVAKPGFLSVKQLETARREFTKLVAIGDAKSFLGKLAIAWAKSSPKDIRVPEVLFIAVQANKSYKYGCGGWEKDERVTEEAESILRNRYPESPWTAMLSKTEK